MVMMEVSEEELEKLFYQKAYTEAVRELKKRYRGELIELRTRLLREMVAEKIGGVRDVE